MINIHFTISYFMLQHLFELVAFLFCIFVSEISSIIELSREGFS